MGKRKTPPPLWVQVFVIWLALSGLLTFGIFYLRATETLSDRVFQPFAMVLCGGNDQLATGYDLRAQDPRRDFGDPRDIPQRPIWSLSAAECVGPSGTRRPARGLQPLVGLTVSVLVALLLFVAGLGRRRRRRR